MSPCYLSVLDIFKTSHTYYLSCLQERILEMKGKHIISSEDPKLTIETLWSDCLLIYFRIKKVTNNLLTDPWQVTLFLG